MKRYCLLFLILYYTFSYSSDNVPVESKYASQFLDFLRSCRAGKQLNSCCAVKYFGDIQSSETPVCIYSQHNADVYMMSYNNRFSFTPDAQPSDFAGTPLADMLQWLHDTLKTPGDDVILFAPGVVDEQVVFERCRTAYKRGSHHFTGFVSTSDGVRTTRRDCFLDSE